MYKTFPILILLSCIACSGNKSVAKQPTPVSTTSTVVLSNTKEKPSDTIADIGEKQPQILLAVDEKSKDIPLDTLPVVVAERNQVKHTIVTEIFDHTLWNTLLQKYVSKTGVVNYKGFKKERALLKSYQNALSATVPSAAWSTEDKLAYWMNVYNVFTVQLIIDHYPTASIKDIKDPWGTRFFKLGAKWYNLNDIEHKILRKMGDPRIHFGINCASFSCPPLLNKAFTSANVNKELEKLSVKFINDPLRNTITPNTIQLSKIFSWFAKDFKTKGTLIQFLNQYSTVTINNSAKKTFKSYNWDLNE